MQDKDKQLTITNQAGASVVEFCQTSILDEQIISQIGDELSELVSATEMPLIVLDFEHVTHMSSSALGMLITLHKQVRQHKGSLRMCNINRDIYEIFAITKLADLFEIHPTLAQALSHLV